MQRTNHVDINHVDINLAVLSGLGFIEDVNDTWIATSIRNKMNVENHGIGTNYFDYWPHDLAPHARLQLMSVIDGRTPMMTSIYSCFSDAALNWCLLLAFPRAMGRRAGAVVWHLNITPLLPLTFDGEAFRPASITEALSLNSIVETITTAIVEAIRVQSPPAMPALESVAQASQARDPLTRRQRDVLKCLSKGMSNAEIAVAIGASENTVRIHVSGILKRLGVKSRLQAAVMAAQLFPAEAASATTP